MSRLEWDKTGERFYETGVDHVVLYPTDATGAYAAGVAWNGVTAATESPSGAEANPQYADNIKYLNLISAEDYGMTLEALTYPDEFAVCDGSAEPVVGLTIGQQKRRQFGLAYRTRVGNDVAGDSLGYKLHIVYNCLAAPSERAYQTVNDSPEPAAFSWEITTTPVAINATDAEGNGYNPTALLILDSTKIAKEKMAAVETLLYGTNAVADGEPGTDPKLPTPDEIINILKAAG